MRMRLSLVLLVPALLLSGCVANMPELKERLGYHDVPVYLPPIAKAQANTTNPLVGAPVRFTTEGTRDPQALPLDFTWSLGDGATALGETVTHVYARPGEFAVRLVVTNAGGLTDQAALVLEVAQGNRRPVAAFTITDEAGLETAKARVGEKLTFDPSASSDPDGAPLSFDWDFADGTTSHAATATHAFAAPGLYAVRLKATDAGGLTADATRTIAVDGEYRFTGSFALAAEDAKQHAIVVPAALAKLTATLTFEAGVASNLTLVLKDAAGAEVARRAPASGPSLPGAQAVVSVELTRAQLASFAPGAWSVQVLRGAPPVSANYAVVVAESF